TYSFRDYLEREIVSNVELIFFLSYDVWDGCLVYDGRVSASVEQLLLEYIRNCFLDRDRLRSRFEDWYQDRGEDNEAKDGGKNKKTTRLGAGRKRFREAVKSLIDPEQAGNPPEHLQYCGDLRLSSSEYDESALPLGFRSCLYIPVGGPFVPQDPFQA